MNNSRPLLQEGNTLNLHFVLGFICGARHKQFVWKYGDKRAAS
jgi:hypothetical protein